MKDVFIVRPFGTKEGINFDEVESKLIRPVLQKLGISGGTTGEITRAGNIRLDMFERLLTADLVIADISIHNANVYYELGVRHALRDQATILIRCRAHDVPFDLKTDRYLEYDGVRPERAIDHLADVVEETMNSKRVDSPVYLLVPELEVHDVSNYRVVPPAFREAVAQAESSADSPLLGLLYSEAQREVWSEQGARLIGRGQFQLGEYEAARRTWEKVRSERPDDPEANTLLGTIYQRLGDLPKSSESLERILIREDLPGTDRAETHALIARNIKTAWIQSWSRKNKPDRPQNALRSQSLIDAMERYRKGFLEDQNHYYAGLNALSLYVILIELSSAYPAVWASRFEDPMEAEYELGRIKKRRRQLAAAVMQSLEAAQYRIEREGKSDVWLDLSIADYRLLESDEAEFVRSGYCDARSRLSQLWGGDTEELSRRFPATSAARQISMYLELGILQDKSRGALEELGYPDGFHESIFSSREEPRARIIVSTGHRIDSPDRTVPRFPGTQESIARKAIREAVKAEVVQTKGTVEGLSGCASGNDILFQEICIELDIQSTICLPIPIEDYLKESVADSGPDWVERFGRLCQQQDLHILSDFPDLPPWIDNTADYSVFQRGNIWLLEFAFARQNPDVTLIALWDGAVGEGPGGTADMVQLATEHGAKIVILDTRELFKAG